MDGGGAAAAAGGGCAHAPGPSPPLPPVVMPASPVGWALPCPSQLYLLHILGLHSPPRGLSNKLRPCVPSGANAYLEMALCHQL
jgi:hypothetical protein